MTASTMTTAAAPDWAVSDIPLAAARTVARGRAQRQWLAALASAEGLRVADYLPRRYAGATYERMSTLFNLMWDLGYDLEHRLGPRGGRGTWHLTGYRPQQAPLRGILRKLHYRVAADRDDQWRPNELLAALGGEAPGTVRSAIDLLEEGYWCKIREVGHNDGPANLARLLDTCRSDAGASELDSFGRGQLLSRILVSAESAGQPLTLEQAGAIADAITA